mgnify:CR=1 FL=1
MKVMITGIAGFIGMHTAVKFKQQGWDVCGFDNFNNYYDPKLKKDRAKQLLDQHGIIVTDRDLRSKWQMDTFVTSERPDLVIHLAAMAGVRYSMDHADEYIDNNILGTHNLITACETAQVENVIYASTSCVMHGNELPWSPDEKLGKQLSPYGYSKATNEHMFHISNIENAVCLRFFTVYGPWGRPDMALFDFSKNILADNPIHVFNNGDMKRDFTYVDDIVAGIWVVSQNMSNRETYCIGNGQQVDLMHFISEIESNLDKKAEMIFKPKHPADAQETWSDTTKIEQLGYKSQTPIEQGVKNFVQWYRNYYGKNT